MSRGYVYMFEAHPRVGEWIYKIGFTTNVAVRMRSIQTTCPYQLELYHSLPGSKDDERRLHRLLAAERMHGEWFCGDLTWQFIWGVLETNSLDETIVLDWLAETNEEIDKAQAEYRALDMQTLESVLVQ